MWRRKAIQTQYAHASAREMTCRCAAHRAEADNNDVVDHWCWSTRSAARSSMCGMRDYLPPAGRGGSCFRYAYSADTSVSLISRSVSNGMTLIALPSGRLPLRNIALNFSELS